MSAFFWRVDKSNGYCKIFRWENGKAVYVRSLGTAEKHHKRLSNYESGERARKDLLKMVQSENNKEPNQE